MPRNIFKEKYLQKKYAYHICMIDALYALSN